jgi:hypothetical protein
VLTAQITKNKFALTVQIAKKSCVGGANYQK